MDQSVTRVDDQNIYNQSQADPDNVRGSIRINPDTGEGLVSLFQKSNHSTFVHEMAHWMFFNMKRLAESGYAREGFVNDFNVISSYLNDRNTLLGLVNNDDSWSIIEDLIKRDENKALRDFVNYNDDQKGLSTEQKAMLAPVLEAYVMNDNVPNSELGAPLASFKDVLQQELLARSFERYLMEGKAPSTALGKVFSKFKAWLKKIYRDLTALNAPINDDVRGVFARMLARDDEIAAKEEMNRTIGQLAEEYNLREQLIDELVNSGVMNESAWRAYHNGSIEGFESAKAHYEDLRNKQRGESERRQEIRNTVRIIRGSLRDDSIDSYKRDEIAKLIDAYDLKRRTKSEQEVKADIDAYFADPEDLSAELAGFPGERVQYLRKELIQNMSLAEIMKLQNSVEVLVREGREIYRLKEAAFREQVDKIALEAVGLIPEFKRDMNVITGHQDLNKKSNLTGKVYSKLLTPMRLIDWIEGGAGKYDGPLSRLFTWAVNKAKDTELKIRTERITRIQNVMRENGVTLETLASKRIINTEGLFNGEGIIVPFQEMTVDQMLSIAVAMRNKKAMNAVFFGNFRDLFSNLKGDELEAAQRSFTAKVFSQLNQNELNVANAIVQDGDIHFNRIDAAMRAIFNYGMKKEENYMTLYRLAFNSEDGLIDAADADGFTKAAVQAGKMAKPESGFRFSRYDTAEVDAIQDAEIRTKIQSKIQQPVKLGLYENFIDNAATTEHIVASGETLKLMRNVLTWKDQHGKQLLKDRIINKFGTDVWRELIGYHNTIALNESDIVRAAMDGFVGKLTNGFAATHLAYNLITPFKQFSALPRFLGLAGPGNLLKAIMEASINPNAFMANLDLIAPQLKDRMNDFNTRNMKELSRMNLPDGNWLTNKLNAFNMTGMQGISYLDKFVAAVGYRAVFLEETGKGKSHDDAARIAQQAVLLTQQAQHAKDLPRLLRLGGAWRLMNLFATQVAARANMVIYDLPVALRQGEFQKFLGISAGLALELMVIGLMTKGLPDFDDDEDWFDWGKKVFTYEFLNTIPLIGKELAAWNDGFSGQWGTLTAPIVKFMNSASKLFDDDKDFNAVEDSMNLLEAVSVFSPWHLPVTGVRRLLRSGDDVNNDDYNRAVLRLFGMPGGRGGGGNISATQRLLNRNNKKRRLSATEKLIRRNKK